MPYDHHYDPGALRDTAGLSRNQYGRNVYTKERNHYSTAVAPHQSAGPDGVGRRNAPAAELLRHDQRIAAETGRPIPTGHGYVDRRAHGGTGVQHPGAWVNGRWQQGERERGWGFGPDRYGRHDGWQRRGYDGRAPVRYGAPAFVGGPAVYTPDALALDLTIPDSTLANACRFTHTGDQPGMHRGIMSNGQYIPSPLDNMSPIEIAMTRDACRALELRRSSGQ